MHRGIFGAPSRNNGNALPRTRSNITRYVFVSLLLVSTSLLLLSSSSFILEFKNIGLSIFFGARGGIYKLSSFVSRTVLSVKELADLRKEYAELLIQLERYRELERSNAEIIQENIRLRNQLEFSRTLRYRRIAAQISGRDPDNLFSALVINKGSFSGVANNMTAVAWQNGTQALVGKVIQTGVFESLIMPIYDVNSLVSSRFSISRFEGIVEGQGNHERPLLMRYIPKREKDEINIGDMIISSGMGGVFPAGVNIGRVSGINALEYANTLELELEPVIDFSRLEYIFLIEAGNVDNDETAENND
jgi:rod shape-determining protein MreC